MCHNTCITLINNRLVYGPIPVTGVCYPHLSWLGHTYQKLLKNKNLQILYLDTLCCQKLLLDQHHIYPWCTTS